MDKVIIWGRRQAKDVFRRLGLTVFETRYQPFGIDLIEDISRLHPEPAAPKMVFDVGANVGEWTAAWLRRFPNSTVHCFEPFPENARKLLERFKAKHVNVQQIALSDTNSERRFFVYKRSSLNSFLCNNENQTPISSLTVVSQQLDKWIQENKIYCIDVLKIDAEKEDLAIIHGGIRTIRACSVKFIIVEHTFNRSFGQKTHYDDFCNVLFSEGFCIASVQNQVVDKNKGFKFGNILFMKTSMIESSRDG